MSEYWVSNKKYFCKYCNIYIADDKPSRTQHEGGLRHKGNVERFVRGLYKAGEKRKQDLEEEKREMARVERAAQAAFAQDVGAGLIRPGSSDAAPSSSKQAGPSRSTAKPSDPYTNYSTAASLGYVDPDAERQKIEAERRMKEGVVGEWEVVEVPSTGTEGVQDGQTEGQADASHTDTHDDVERKRPAEIPADDDDIRPWKLRKKTVGTGLGEIYDPGVILPIKLKAKKEDNAASTTSVTPNTATSTSDDGTNDKALPKWTAKGWNRPGEHQEPLSVPKPTDAEKERQPSPAQEPPPPISEAEPEDALPKFAEVKVEEGFKLKAEEAEAQLPSATGSLFRKRKAPAGARGRR